MSRKTKADLEVEIRMLQTDNASLREMVGVLNEELDAEIKNGRVKESAYNADIAKLVKRDARKMRNKWEAFYREQYLRERFKVYREKKLLPNKAREEANADMAKKYNGYTLKKRQLIELLKD